MGGASRVDTLPDGFAELLRGSKEPEPGQTIGGRYRLVEHIAEGAMGNVYVAENVAINLRVAVKILKPDLLANPEFRIRFQQEAQAVAAIDHPNVVRFLDLVVGVPTFLVMEHVAGETLAATLKRERRLPVPRAVAIAASLCRGLAAAHASGVIHRDLKPHNIIVGRNAAGDETPKIIDFGLAKVMAAEPNKGKLTRLGQIVGTPEYMAPEQIGGKTVDARTDVYALGCVLFEMIAGRTPFPGHDGDVQVLYRQVNEDAPPVDAFAPAPPAVVQALMRALAKEPEGRYPSMVAMATALERSIERSNRQTDLTGRVITAITTAAPPSPRRWLAPAVAAALAAVAGVAIGLVAARGHAAGKKPAGPAGVPVLVGTTPEGASVTVDGRAFPGVTPLSIPLAPGPHTLTLAHPDRGGVDREITVAAGKNDLLLITLPLKSRPLLVETVPSGARVFLDDQLLAETSPATISVTDDDFHELRLEKTGFEPLVKHLGPQDRDAELRLTLEAARAPRGELYVNSGAEAEVYVDGKDTGFETPTLGIHVIAGAHTVQIRDSSGRESAPAAVTIDAGQVVRVSLNL
jgi:serine/threonine-protein kinase